MENTTANNVKEEFKVIPVRENTRERLKNDMMKRDTYDSYINKKLDRVAELEKQVALLSSVKAE
jgi:hypothetical protein